ncbi:MAG: tRNA 2-thiouridine(34) synthase MnmA [bacterium (Candidatus Stahlbacteria) CG08_land_8_20_14_0_20_40_26]|nr:MAG: tRNA 2-thiouridine(34) synthase MnmA [bacterium (Candidatus Stahlbacteria) CG08_land_8_20_14_0_20_40_26]
MMDVAVLMSGGVDSSIAALILKEEGYNVVGVTLDMHKFSRENIKRTKKITKKIKIPHIVLDVKQDFQREIIQYFIDEYKNGMTPNPCVVCNSQIKFGIAMDRLKFNKFATGHYARISHEDSWVLKRGTDRLKDQSYFLAMIDKKRLKHIIFPLGNYKKETVRRMAKKIGIQFNEQCESQEICFIEGSYLRFLENIVQTKEGDIVDTEGNVIGKHNGISGYTIGQRKGIKKPDTHPYYVVKIDLQNNRLIVGRERDLYSNILFVKHPNWLSIPPPNTPLSMDIKIRYGQTPVKAVFYPDKNMVKFLSPQRAITPGQIAAFYAGETLLGGGWIS